MKKVININFQGRVVPIEETAYELLKSYVESLRNYFAKEEGRDEIINDIESRIAELFSERIKKGSTCITDADVDEIISGMGRPADFEAQDSDSGSTAGTTSAGSSQQSEPHSTRWFAGRRLVRNADDKVIGGVCSGLANYLGIDPIIVRIIFVLLFGALFWVYILLWIIVPSQSVQSNITKRLYRNPDDKVISGVCGGIASYFNIDSWIPRVIFALPLIIALISGTFHAFWWDWDFGMTPRIISGSLGWTLMVIYVILWIAVPVASTAAERLEMKGERINLNSIRDTVNEDLGSLKSRAEKWGTEVKESAQQLGEKAREFGQTAGSKAKSFASEAAPLAKSGATGLGRAIVIIFKAFFLFIAAIVAFALFGAFISVIFGGYAIFPLKNFFLGSFTEDMLAWSTLFLFLGIPLVAMITLLVRRIIGVRSRRHYLGYVFGTLWFIGLISAIVLAAMIARNFRSRSVVEETVSVVSPHNGKILVELNHSNFKYYGTDWFGMEDEGWPVFNLNQDSLLLNTVRVNIAKSRDSSFHIYKMKFGRGNNVVNAKRVAEKIQFDIIQNDSMLILPRGFAVSKNEKFRNQQVLVVVEVPVGKRIEIDRSVDYYEWFSINFNRRRGWDVDWDDHWDNNYNWESNVEYIMTPEGMERLDRLDKNELKQGRYKLNTSSQNEMKKDTESSGEGTGPYRYKRENDTTIKEKEIKKITEISVIEQDEVKSYRKDIIPNLPSYTSELSMPLSVFSRLFQ